MKKFMLVISVIATAAGAAWSRPCAQVFQYAGYAGASLQLNSNSQLDLHGVAFFDASENTLRGWDNVISSVQVFPGCVLTGYQYQNFNINYEPAGLAGWTVSWKATPFCPNNVPYLSGLYDNRISSLTCFCAP